MPPAGLDTVRRILRDHAPGLEARAFGSRVSWTAQETSDLDLVLMTESPLDAGRMAALRAAFSGSDLPFRVDVADWAAVSEDFRGIINENSVTILKNNYGTVNARWTNTTLGVFCPLSYGKGLKADNRNQTGHIPVFGSNGRVGWHDKPLSKGPTVIIGRKGTVGAVHYSPIPCWPIDTTFFITEEGEGLIRFKYFMLTSLNLAEMNGDSAVPGLNRDAFHQLKIPLPSIAEQRAIAEILGAFDDKIELNRRMNETLEAMARAIFDDWFVDFGPARARMEGRKPYLAPEVWRLFPDRIDADTGAPEGWRPGVLGDIAVSEHRAVAPAEVAADTPYIGLEHMPRRSIALSRWGRADQVKTPKLRFEAGEFLFGRLRPYFHKAGVAPFDGICSTTIAVVRPVSQEWSAPVLACISSESFVDFADRSSTGTTMPQTSWEALSRYELAIPPPALAAAYGDAVAPMRDRIVANVRESHALADARDSLLPRLMSGRISISNFR